MRKALIALFVALFATAALTATVSAAPDAGKARGEGKGGKHDLAGPLAAKQRALRSVALEKQLRGEIPKGAKVGKVAKGQYVELAREGEDAIWTLIAEFGDQPATHNHGSFGTINHGGGPGPEHNEIPEPDRSVDNTTIWAPDFSETYYETLLFDDSAGANSMRNYYKEQSSGRYAVNGDVTPWVQVPYNGAAYGSNYCGSIVCARDTWRLIEDAVTAFGAGKSAAELNAYLGQFDVWDRYDHDGDGNFDESDGYIDHFQIVHAGEGEETGGGALGEDAIWSHRSYDQTVPIGAGGPTLDDGTVVPFGGQSIPGSKYWIGDYTIEPENGGVGVFAHEYAHDLGLPDEYDTSGNTGGAENSTGFWTLMSSGSYGNNGEAEEGIGNRPFHMNAWDKFQLGWLNYDVAFAGKSSSHRLGPSATNTKQSQGVFVVLPQKSVPLNLGAPYAGDKYYYSGSGNNLDNSMTRSVTLGAAPQMLTAKVRYDIETDWDYAYLTVNGDPVETSRSTTTDPNGQNFGFGITGSSGGSWVDLTADLSAFAGQTVTIGFRYWTDVAVVEPGFQADEISVGGQTYGAEADGEFTLDGFRITTGSETQLFNNYYLAENRQYLGYDAGLRTGPYNFGGAIGPNWAERFPYQDGVLIWYWDTSQSDNNVGDHPGEGLILPIDSHPGILTFGNGTQMRPRLQAFDATFGLQSTDAITLYSGGVPTTIPSRPGEPVFDDTKSWWTAGHPSDAPGDGRYQAEWNSVKTPNTGTQIRVINEAPTGFTQIEVRPAK